MRRRLHHDPESGVYAILYAVLVVILLGMAAIVVDFASVRQDRRLGRSAADAAALGGVALLNNSNGTSADPNAACLQAWRYLSTTLQISTPLGACDTLPTAGGACYTASPPQALITDARTAGPYLVKIAWPIPVGGDDGFLTPDIAPGGVTQPANTSTNPGPRNTDGYTNGCDKLGVAIFQNPDFGLGGVFGYNGTTTQVHSVARFIPESSDPDDAAALNVLNPNECPTIRTTGTGKVLVGPTLKNDGTYAGPGIIAVESAGTKATGNRGCTSSNDKTIDAGTSGTFICALDWISTTCAPPYGRILTHTLDPGGDATHSYSGNVFPAPEPEGGVHGWGPVTRRYGCATLSNCDAPTPNYIARLVAAYGPNSMPTTLYDGNQAPYTACTPASPPCTTPPTFVNRPELCPSGGGGVINGIPVIIPAGYNYADCDLKIGSTGTVIVQGGTLVVKGSVDVQGGGCFVMNSPTVACPTAVASGSNGAQITTPFQPDADAVLFVRGVGCPNPACINVAGSIVWPQTFVYMGGSSPFVYSGTTFSLWTAPGAGPRDGDGRTTLERLCGANATASPAEACMNSRFARLNFWTEHSGNSTSHTFTGQANLGIVGIFFAPNDLFNLSGGQNLSAVAAQFWADRIDITGSGTLPLSPFEGFSQPPDRPRTVLIR